MNDRQLLTLLRKRAQETKLTYIAESVKVKLLTKQIRNTRLQEQFLPRGQMDTGDSGLPSSKGIARGAASVGSMGYDYPDPDILSGMMDEDHISDPEVVQFIGSPGSPASGKGSYAQMLSDLKAAKDAAKQAGDQSWSLEKIIAAFTAPGRSPEEMKMIRSAAARVLRGTSGSGRKSIPKV